MKINIKIILIKIKNWFNQNVEVKVYFDPAKQTYRDLSQFGIKGHSDLIYNESEISLEESIPVCLSADFSELHYIHIT